MRSDASRASRPMCIWVLSNDSSGFGLFVFVLIPQDHLDDRILYTLYLPPACLPLWSLLCILGVACSWLRIPGPLPAGQESDPYLPDLLTPKPQLAASAR